VPKLFFEQGDRKSCGLCIKLLLAAEFDKPMIVVSVDDNGTSPRKLRSDLRKMGIETDEPKRITFRNLKPWSILHYPRRGKKGCRGDHYVTFERAENGKFLINDSVEEGPRWLEESELKKKWYRRYRNRWCGWVIEVRKPDGKD
jgi:ABC-type bacteriocin/lantibiotic exporter with double-glycine peptidase domain